MHALIRANLRHFPENARVQRKIIFICNISIITGFSDHFHTSAAQNQREYRDG
jgi:hypothetical protein